MPGKSWAELWATSTGGQLGHKPKVIASIVKKLHLTNHTTLLDVGCGNGSLLAKLPAKKKAGLDFSPLLVKQARARGLAVLEGNATKLPFKDNSFDKVLSYSVMIYLPLKQAERAIAEMKRVCKPGGRVLVGDNADAARYPGGKLRHAVRELALGILGRTHSTYFTKEWFERQGFRTSPSANSPLRFDAVLVRKRTA